MNEMFKFDKTEKGMNEMFKFDKTDKGYIARVTEKIAVERGKEVDSLILGEIRKIAIDNEIETKIILNEKNVAEALRNYQNGYKRLKAEVAREIFAEIAEIRTISRVCEKRGITYDVSGLYAELEKKYTEN